jgi:MFS family permease
VRPRQAAGAPPAGGRWPEPVERVGRRWITLIALANLGLYLGYRGPISVLLPNQVQAIAGPAHKVAVLGVVAGIGAAVAMIANPVAGALSDRTVSRFGRRRPWIACGAVAGAAALVLLAGQHALAGCSPATRPRMAWSC